MYQFSLACRGDGTKGWDVYSAREVDMRRLFLAFLVLVAASVASAQVLTVGAAGGATWELHAEADSETSRERWPRS